MLLMKLSSIPLSKQKKLLMFSKQMIAKQANGQIIICPGSGVRCTIRVESGNTTFVLVDSKSKGKPNVVVK